MAFQEGYVFKGVYVLPSVHGDYFLSVIYTFELIDGEIKY